MSLVEECKNHNAIHPSVSSFFFFKVLRLTRLIEHKEFWLM